MLLDNLLEKVKTYWTQRSTGYCRTNEEELNSFKYKAWTDIIHQYAPRVAEEPLAVLDAGTGPGFLALIMAGEGHKVTAIDCTEAMLDKARGNAKKYNRVISFEKMDAQDLAFADSTFDLVLTRNLTWNLERPEKAYREFYRVLSPGGRLLNFDANWYLHLHDPRKRQAYEQDRLNVRKYNCPDHYSSTDTKTMENIAAILPLSRAHRPEWDTGILARVGFKKIIIEMDIQDRVWDREEKINYGSTPMFMVCVEKTMNNVEFM